MSGPSLRWDLPRNDEDALILLEHYEVIARMVESCLDDADEGAFEDAEELVEICDTLRVPAEVVLDSAEGPAAEARRVALPESVELLVADGGRSFTTQPETCPECGLTLDENGECQTQGCSGPE